jgi:hypothetical protein
MTCTDWNQELFLYAIGFGSLLLLDIGVRFWLWRRQS